MAKYDETDGIWRTIGGRRVFIKNGQSLSDAMKKSGKFKLQKKEKKYSEMSKEDIDKEIEKLQQSNDTLIDKKKMDEMYNKWYDYKPKFIEENGFDPSGEDREEWFRKNYPEYEKAQQQKEINNKEINRLIGIQQDKQKAIELDKINDIKQEHKFYSNDIRDIFNSVDEEKYAVEKARGLIALDKKLKSENKTISTSPYSFSIYGINDGEKIDWDSKPVGSYRLSDHWNFESRGKTHCKLKGERKYKQSVILARYNGKEYEIIEEFKNE